MFGMKKYLLITLALGGLSLTTVGIANARPHGSHMQKMLFKDLDLSEEQRAELKEMRQRKKEYRKDGKKEGRKDWMVEFINGDLSRNSLHDDMDQNFEKMHAFHKENLSEMFDFIDALEGEQRAQFLENIDDLKEKMKQKRSRADERREKRERTKSSFIEKLFSDIQLTSKQKRQVENIREMQMERKGDRKAFPPKRFVVLEEYASGSQSRTQILRDFNRAGQRKIQHKHEVTDLWLNLISSLDEEQKDQLVHNQEELREKRKNRKEKRKARKKERRERKERLDSERDSRE
ncbi:MAG: Spy/CpxP family protein refolding chaperone [Myxococcota bacterium]|nr:Spy/CpxP family protein refolding chaperone [Myxococcota bacterium]